MTQSQQTQPGTAQPDAAFSEHAAMTGAAMNDAERIDAAQDPAEAAASTTVFPLADKPLAPQADTADARLGLRIAAERLSIVRYVFLVQIEDGIASAAQRASLEYADAVLIGWPDEDSPEVTDLDQSQLDVVREQITLMEQYIRRFSTMERENDIDGMTDTLIRVTERVAEVRRLYQPGFLLPTFAEIRRVVQEEWDEDMGKIDPQETDPTADQIEQETERADDDAQGGGDHSGALSDGAQSGGIHNDNTPSGGSYSGVASVGDHREVVR